MEHCLLSGEILSNICGVLSSVVWFFVLIPQIHTNYQKQNADAISLSLILLWIVGDIFSMISAQQKGVSVVVINIAIYHIVIGVLFCMQIFYYRIINKINYISVGDNEITPLLLENLEIESERNKIVKIIYLNELLFLGVSVISIVGSLRLLKSFDKIIIADIIGWIATCIFILSRIPQIYLNHQRKSTDGLNINSFILVNVANFLFLSSILVNLCDVNDNGNNEIQLFILNNLQWILGSSLTVLFDLIIFYQFYIFK